MTESKEEQAKRLDGYADDLERGDEHWQSATKAQMIAALRAGARALRETKP